MCLSIPAKVEKIVGDKAEVSVGGAYYTAGLHMVEDIEVGDYVLLHTGFAIQKISEDEALETLKLFEEFSSFNQDLDEEEKESGTRIT